MGVCFSRKKAKYDPTAPLVIRDLHVRGLVPSLRRLVRQQTVRFWPTLNRLGDSYNLRLVPPYSIQGGNLLRTVTLYRDKDQEGGRMLVFKGVCDQGFRYQVTVTPMQRRAENGKIMHQMYLGCIKHAATPDDYAIEYELVLYQ